MIFSAIYKRPDVLKITNFTAEGAANNGNT